MVAAVARTIMGARRGCGTSLEEGVLNGGRIAENERSLAEVVQRKGGINEVEPGTFERLRTEVADVSVERLAAGHGEQDHAHDDDAVVAVMDQVENAPVWGQGLDDLRMLEEAVKPESGEGEEPQHHDGTKGDADFCGAVLLDHEEPQDDGHGNVDDDLL